jgi:valyl-tRNA synthetase
MPFVTEELWGKLGDRADYPLITAKWPEPGVKIDREATWEINYVIRLVSSIRAARTELNVPPATQVIVKISGASEQTIGRISRNLPAIKRLARIEALHELRPEFGLIISGVGEERGTIPAYLATQGGAAQIPVEEATFIIPLEGVIDIAAEKARLEKALAVSQKEAKSLEGRLSNPAFAEKAKPEAVEKARADHAAHAAEAERLAAALARLG